MQIPHIPLRLDDGAQAEAAGEHHHAHQRQAHEHLVADHLRGAAQAAEQGVLVVGRQAAQQHAVHRQGGHAQEKQQADIDIEYVQVRAERHHRKTQQHGHHDGGGCEHEHQRGRRRAAPSRAWSAA